MTVEELIKELQEMVERGSLSSLAEVVVDADCAGDWHYSLDIEIEHRDSTYNKLIINAKEET